MPDEAERRRQHELARQALMRRFVRDDRPRVRVRLPRRPDPLLIQALVALATGLTLVALGILLDPPLALLDRIRRAHDQ